jgi:hypothetical protein
MAAPAANEPVVVVRRAGAIDPLRSFDLFVSRHLPRISS